MVQVSRQKQLLQEEKSFDSKPGVKLFRTRFQVYAEQEKWVGQEGPRIDVQTIIDQLLIYDIKEEE